MAKPINTGYTVINGTTTGSNGSKVDTWIEYKTTQNTSANTSSVDIYLYAQANKSGLSTKWEVSASYGSITLNGTSHAGATMSGGYDFTSTSKLNTFAHYTETVSHNADGTKTITIAGSWNKGSSSSTYITGGNVPSTSITLPQIPRASTVTATTCNVGTQYSITVTKANSSYYHQLSYSFTVNGTTHTANIGSKTNSTTVDWTPTANTFLPLITGSQIVGTLTCKTYASSSATSVIGTSTATLTLKIPLVTAGNIIGTIGSSSTVNVTRLNDSSISWTLKYTFGSATSTTSKLTSSSTTISWADTLAQQIPNATSGTGSITIQTYHYINSTYTSVGSTTYTLTLSVPSSMTPTASVTLTKVNSNATVNTWNVWLQGYTKVQAQISGSGVQGSTVALLSINGTGINASGTTSPLSATTANAITSATTETYNGSVTDSRGKTKTATASATFLPYATPSLKSIKIVRCNSSGTATDEGTYLKPTFSMQVSPCGTTNGQDNNTGSVKLQYKEATDTVYTDYNNGSAITSGSPITITDGFEANTAYNVRLVITDTLGNSSTSAVYSIPTAERIINVNASGSGLAFGRFSSIQGALQSAYPAYFEDDVYIGSSYVQDVFTEMAMTVISTNDDLNDYTTTGVYRCQNSATTQSLSNSPYTEGIWADGTTGFRLEVYSTTGTGYGFQIMYTHNVVQRTYIRSLNGGTWRAWHRIVGDDETYYRVNDTFASSAYMEMSGHSTGNAKRIVIGFAVPKSMANISSIEVTRLTGSFFGSGGLINSATDANWITTSGISLTPLKTSDNTVRIYVDSTTAFTNTSFYTPVSYYGHVTLKFT